MMNPWLRMVYDRDGACWMVQIRDCLHVIHCGECFELCIGERGIPCCWSLIGNGL